MSNQPDEIPIEDAMDPMEESRIAEGQGPLETAAQFESVQHNSKGWKLHRQGRFSEAIDEFSAAVCLNPRNALALNNKALSLRCLGELDEAVKCFDDAIAVAPRFVKPYSNKAMTLTMMDSIEEAKKWFDKALEVEPGYPQAMHPLNQLCAYELSADAKGRREWFEREYPEATNLIKQASEYMVIPEFQLALPLIDRALELASGVSEFHDVRAACLIGLDRCIEASQSAKYATQLYPKNAEAFTNLACAHLRLGEFERCVEYSQIAIALNSQVDMAWANAGAALLFLGRCQEAAKNLRRALSLNPRNCAARYAQEVYTRINASPQYHYLGWELLDIAEVQLKEGYFVAMSFDFLDADVPWGRIIALARRYPKFIVRDMIDRTEDQINHLISFLERKEALGLAYDVKVLAKWKLRATEGHA